MDTVAVTARSEFSQLSGPSTPYIDYNTSWGVLRTQVRGVCGQWWLIHGQQVFASGVSNSVVSVGGSGVSSNRLRRVLIVIWQEFSWEDHGYSLLAKYFPVAADSIDRLLSTTLNLTYNDFGTESEHFNTETFRRAIWCVRGSASGVRVGLSSVSFTSAVVT